MANAASRGSGGKGPAGLHAYRTAGRDRGDRDFGGPAIAHLEQGQGNGAQNHCASNLRQIGIGVRLYADDHNGEIPDSDTRFVSVANPDAANYYDPKGPDIRAQLLLAPQALPPAGCHLDVPSLQAALNSPEYRADLPAPEIAMMGNIYAISAADDEYPAQKLDKLPGPSDAKLFLDQGALVSNRSGHSKPIPRRRSWPLASSGRFPFTTTELAKLG